VADDTLRRTPLFDRHVALGARIIPFAGWEMPVQYSGIIAEHNAVRNQAGLFDLGHMGQVDVTGPDALAYLQATTTNDVSALQPGEAQYAMLPNEHGGVIDDILIYRRPEGGDYMVVVNASNRFRDVAWMQEQRERLEDLNVTVRDISDETAMIAIQGPNAAAITQSISGDDLSDIAHYHWRSGTVAGIPVMIARTGYTGEDGFEIYGPIDTAGTIWDVLMEAGKEHGLQPIGLGARDTLRLESRMPLYGQELGDDISPYEAGLGWAVKLNKGDFVGREGMAQVKSEGPKRKAVGFRMTERSGAPRTHYPVGIDGNVIGEVTSGAFSPTLGENIGLALIAPEYAGVGKPLQVEIRGKWINAEQIKMPFYKRSGQ
jgi:glycine cleavage system T protein (aminomethyltransferase)